MLATDKKLDKVNLETVTDNLLSAIIVLNRNLIILLANKMAAVYAGKHMEVLPGLRPGEALNCVHSIDHRDGCGSGPRCGDCRIRKMILETLNDRNKKKLRETCLNLKKIGRRYFRMSTTYLAEQDLVLLAMEDITDLKVMETENMEKSKLLAAVNTAGAVCHEMNQPLQVISAHLEMFKLKKDKGIPCDDSHFESMRQQIEKLALITRKLQNIKRFASMSYIEGTDILDLDKSSAF